jgi:hypothetical protein
MKTNITVTLDANLLREISVLAAEDGTSISRFLAEQLEQIVQDSKAFKRSRKRALARLREGRDLKWTPVSRADLHER